MFKSLSLPKLLALNTVSNYAVMIVRVFQGVLITRWLYHYLGDDYYGFWSILWAFFTYMIVFNLGFGAATQKYTAENLFKRDIDKYNRVISIVLGFYLSVSAVISAIAVTASFFLPSWTGLQDPEKISVCQTALIIFGLGTALLFPMSMFTAILMGLKYIYLKNAALIGARISELIGIFLIMYFDLGFIAIVVFSVSINLLFDILLIIMVKREIPGFKLMPSFNMQTMREVCNFSLFAYLTSIGNMIIAKTDRFVLSAIIGLPAVSSYQIGTRIPDLSQTLATPFQENVMPLSANLIHTGDTRRLSSLLLSGMRFSSFISVGTTVLFFILSGEIIRFMFDANSAEITLICRIFLISEFVNCAVRGVPARYLLMSGKHKMIAYTTLAEAVMNISLSIFLCLKIGIMGVVWGTIIPSLIVTFLIIMPSSIRSLKFTAVDLSLIFVKPFLAVALPAAMCLLAQHWLGETLSQFFPLAATCAAAGSVYIATSWIFVLTKNEREMILSKIRKTPIPA